jgi:acetylornithine aminotransferase
MIVQMGPDPVGADWLRRHGAALLGTYAPPSMVLVGGEGATVWDAAGRRYLDLVAGIATTVLGHAHPALVAAVREQITALGHVSNLVAHPSQVLLAERLLQVTGAGPGGRVYLCNSGAEANEAAFKMARRTGRPRIVAAEGGFHGRTMGALALTHRPAYRAPFEPLPGGVEHVPFGDVDALRAALDRTGRPDVAAVFLEPVQGEAGVRPAPVGYLAEVRRLTRDRGTLLVLDEVQSGVGRTGHWLAHQAPQHLGTVIAEDPRLRPDIVTLAKGLGGGVPIGAAVTYTPAVSSLLAPGEHGTTFGGNPLASAAALATIETIDSQRLLERAVTVGRVLADGIAALSGSEVAEVRGEGLLIGVDLVDPIAARITAVSRDCGFLVNAVQAGTVRLAPPLVLTAAEATSFVEALPGILGRAATADRAATSAPEGSS